MQKSGFLSAVKRRLVPGGHAPRQPPVGLWRGIKLNLDLACHTQVYLGLYEREIHSLVTRCGRGIKTAFDVGAADGLYTLYFLMRTAADRVIAFEPSSDDRAALDHNLALNGLGQSRRLLIVPASAGSVNGTQQTTLDSVAEGISTPYLVKLDVDGGELDVLRGAARLLQAGPATWIVETHSAELETACSLHFQSFGYEVRVVPNGWWRSIVPEQRPIAHNRWLVAIWRGSQLGA